MGRAITFPATEQATLTEVEDLPPGPNEVAGSTIFTLISPGTELALYTLMVDRLNTAGRKQPFVPGYAAVFRVEQVGSEVEDFENGQIVYAMGPHRSWQCPSADAVLKLPDGLDPAEAVFARIAGVSMSTLVTTTAGPHRYVHVRGGWEFELPLHDEPWRPGSILGNQALALRWLQQGSLRVRDLATEIRPDNIQNAYQSLLRRDGALTRLIRWE